MEFDEIPGGELSPLHKAIGQMFMVGFGSSTVTPEITELIQKYHIGSIILSVKNLKDAESTRDLVFQLQRIAHDAGHEQPLLIAIDQENGMLNNLHDEEHLSQFPGPMAIVATKSTQVAKQVAKATAIELKSLGVNWVLGPVLDVLTNSTNRLLGVRTMGDDPHEVSQFALALLEGFEEANIATCGKHFPGYGNATVDSILGLPIVPESIEQLETASMIPFRQSVKAGIDTIMVGGAALPKIAVNEMHACLSERVVNQLLRQDLEFDGAIVSECLEMDALYENVGVRQGSVMAAVAGCDIILVCSSYRLQREAISGIFGAVQSGIIDEESLFKAASRVAHIKRKRVSWQEALNPPPLSYMKELKKSHAALSRMAYDHSVTLLRDHAKYIPLPHSIEPDSDILLLTPLVTPIISTKHSQEVEHLLYGETVFQEFGKSLAKRHTGKVLHASYTANGLTSLHENLLERAKAVIIVTADANRNMYQIGITKHVTMICNQQRKPTIAIAASSPYDMALDRGVGTYMCVYEFTFEALDTAAQVLFGELPARGNFPGTGLYQRSKDNQLDKATRSKWLVEKWSYERDMKRLKLLWENCFPDRRLGPGLDAFQMLRHRENDNKQQTHFIVRNSSTNNLYGFCATWVYANGLGCIAMIFVEPSRRGMSVGRSLHDRAMKYLLQERKCPKVQLGSSIIPSFFQGVLYYDGGVVPSNSIISSLQWFKQAGWVFDMNEAQGLINNNTSDSEDAMTSPSASGPSAKSTNKLVSTSTMLLTNLQEWTPSKKLISELEMIGIRFDICARDDPRMKDVMRIISMHYSHVEGLLELYQQAQENARIVVALDPVKKHVVGSIILFTRANSLSGYMPWILEFDDARVGGLCGVATDPEYKDLSNIFTLGLVGCGVRQFKLQRFDRCVIDGVSDYQALVYRDNGFRFWRRFLKVVNTADGIR